MIPEAGHRDAGLRPDRRAAQRDLRRLQRPSRCATESTTAKRKVLITADGGCRRGAWSPLKETADEALDECPTVEQVRGGQPAGDPTQVPMKDGPRRLVARPMAERRRRAVEPEALDAETSALHPVHLGHHGQAEGHVHTTGGYLVGTMTHHK